MKYKVTYRIATRKQHEMFAKMLGYSKTSVDQQWLQEIIDSLQPVEWNCKGFLGYKTRKQ